MNTLIVIDDIAANYHKYPNNGLKIKEYSN